MFRNINQYLNLMLPYLCWFLCNCLFCVGIKCYWAMLHAYAAAVCIKCCCVH